MYRLGIDLGGTKIESIALDRSGHELFRKRIPTEADKGYDHILENIANLYRETVQSISGQPHTLGMGTPGAISPRTGKLKGSNTVCMIGKPVRTDLQKKIGRPFAMMNDANCFAMAESLHGAARGRDIVFGIIMGTGCGGGLVVRGQVVNGLQSIAGEWGHMSIDPKGPVCYCGTPGCVETFISGGGAERRYEAMYGEKRKFIDIENDYRAGREPASAFVQDFFQHFGRAVANLIAVLDPDIIVIGGGVSNFDELYTKGVEEVRKRVFSDSLETPIVKHQLGDSAGVIGAALIGF